MEKIFQYEPEIQAIPRIRKDLEELAREWDLPSTALRQIILIVEEIFSFMLPATISGEAESLVEVRISLDLKEITIEMIHDGTPCNPLEHNLIHTTDPAAMDDRGMGISLVRTFADSIEYFRAGNLNHLVIRKTIRKRQTESP